MINNRIIKVQSKYDLERAYPVMKELRQELSYSDFLNIYESAHAENGYELFALEQDKEISALMGYRILIDFVHGKHLYIDDLVSTESQRSKGFGAQLLKYAEDLAQDLNCHSLRLSTGIENEAGKRFYEKHLWNLRAVVFKKKVNGNK